MSAATAATASPTITAAQPGRRGRWIEHWDPDDEAFWAATGERVARKNLILSMFAEHIGFCVWVLWTVVVLNLANHGISLSVSELFLLTLVPNVIGSVLRIPYTFAIPRFGARAWTTASAALLFVPTVLLAVVVPSGWLLHQSHGVQLWVLLACAATAGVGGGNFSSSMANISFFYPESRKGFALGLNAAGGNLGVAVCQLVVPLVVIIGTPAAAVKLPQHRVHLAYAGLFFLPLIALATVLAHRYMDSLRQARADTASYLAALRQSQTWVLSFLYIGTFGSFIGFSFALPLVIKTSFPEFLAHHTFIAVYLGGLGFLGAMIGSLSRPLGGWLSDRMGGARVTLVTFGGMALAAGAAIVGVEHHSFAGFFGAYMVLFFLSGIGNGSTYKMIPSVFSAMGRRHAETTGDDPVAVAVEFKRRAAAVIGIAGSVGAMGGAVVQVVLRQSSLHVSSLVAAAAPADKAAVAAAHTDWSVPALWVFAASYLVFGAVTWFVYLRSTAVEPAANLSEAMA